MASLLGFNLDLKCDNIEALSRSSLLSELDKFTKQSVMDYNLTAQFKERQEMEKKLNKLGKTIDYMERAKREEETPIFEQAFQQRLVEEQHLHEQEQLKERELSRKHHAGDLQEKNRLARMLENKVIFQQRIGSSRREEKDRLRREALLAKSLEPPRLAEPCSPARPEPAPTAGKYVPRHRRLAEAGQDPSAAPLGQSTLAPFAASPDTDSWTWRDGPDTDRWSRRNGPPPPGDRYRSDESRPPPGVGGGSKLPWRRN